jgi:hypothetical protein
MRAQKSRLKTTWPAETSIYFVIPSEASNPSSIADMGAAKPQRDSSGKHRPRNDKRLTVVAVARRGIGRLRDGGPQAKACANSAVPLVEGTLTL